MSPRVRSAVAAVAAVVASPSARPAGPVGFDPDIRPLLAARCVQCHGPDKQKGGLRLDSRAAALAGGDSGPALVPGKAADSLLVKLAAGDDADRVMPPKGDRLTPDQLAKLRAWVDAGADWPATQTETATAHKHWAFRPPQRPPVPEIRNSKPEIRNAIDAFVLARLAKENFSPSPEADKVTLCRRLHLDLIGLPPTPAEVDAFVADRSPDAYGKLVDKLLASPHYGERWARVWLDAARYADSDGFEKDKPRSVWFYRDWVIDAFNRDLPYDRFVTEQVAGDLLPNATQGQRVATGFLRNSMINEEGGVDPEQFRTEAMFDRMECLGKAVLGLTVQCAQCHTHKFDPLTQAEYYKLFAFLNTSAEGSAAVYTPAEEMARADLRRKIAAVEDDLKHTTPGWESELAKWEAAVKGDQPGWAVVRPAVPDETTGGQKFLPRPDGSFLAQGYAATKSGPRFEWANGPAPVTAFRLELLSDPNLPRGGPGRSVEGTGALTEFEAQHGPAGGKMARVKFKKATADVDPPPAPLKPFYHDKTDNSKRLTGPVAFAVDGKGETAWGHDTDPGRRNRPRKAVFVADAPIPAGHTIHVVLKQNHGGWNSDDNQNCNLGRFRLSVTSAPDPAADPLPADVREIVETVPAAERTPAQRAAMFGYWRTTVPAWKDANAKIEALWKEYPEGTTQLVMHDGEARMTRVFKRGDFLKPADQVAPGVPAFLNPLPADAKPDRTGLAKWLTDRNSPTTARAFVNRVWQAHFGAGLVSSPEDLGTQSEPPTHPELLDWLAVEFMDRGWSVKQLHKLIVMSATYRQSSKVSPDLAKRDPENKLLARGPRFRVDAEVVRDIALAASGLLNPTVGGPSVYPPAPAFLFLPPASYGPKVWPEATGPDRYRRGLYVFRFRSVPYPPLAAFDAPPGDTSCVRRSRTNTPLQALTAMNEPTFVEAARALGLRALAAGGTDEERLTDAFRRCVARPPTAEESGVLLELLRAQKTRYAAPDADPWGVAFAGPGEYRKLPNAATPADAAAWTAVARVLLNLDETVTKE